MRQEDPFAIHLLIQSADKIITDYAKNTGKPLAANFDAFIRPEKKKEAYNMLRETYNYLKHADNDWDKLLGVRDLVRLNAITLFYCVANFGSVFVETTDHMRLAFAFNSMLFPDILKAESIPEEMKNSMVKLASATPSEMFDLHLEFAHLLMPNFAQERAADLIDNGDFFSTPFADLQKKEAPGGNEDKQ